ncbi:response regulator [Flavobacterium sp. N1994]|uniref:response regulator n=1 Tax=Flavobacterium sp. N1994 TaxID=2986827 RepID=UPI0022235F00|nr:response regulator [Flavobacterium sp. N1994]
MEVSVLMIDDHPPIIEGYKSILAFNPYGYSIATTSAFSCESAYKIITTTSISYNIVFLDVTLPPYTEKKINSGLDLVAIVRKHLPNSKIVILTSHSESLVLHGIIKEQNPEGLLVKSDILPDDFLFAFDTIVKGSRYYSPSIKTIKLDSQIPTKLLDNYNRQIIILISKGKKTKSIQEELHLSKSAIDKRKAMIKDYLGIDKGNDEDILTEARKQGLI